MHGIGSLIREIDIKISEISETNILYWLCKTNARILSVNTFEPMIHEVANFRKIIHELGIERIETYHLKTLCSVPRGNSLCLYYVNMD